MHAQSQDLPAEQRKREKDEEKSASAAVSVCSPKGQWETMRNSQVVRPSQISAKPWEFFYPVSCLNSGWSFFVLPQDTMGFPTKNSPQNVWWREGDLGEFLRIISILHILKIHHTCFHYDHQDIWKHSAESTTSLTLRVPNVQIWFQMENCPTSWSLRNHEPPITTLLEFFCHLQLAFVPIGKHLSPKAEHRHEFYCKFLWTCSVEVMHWRSAWEDNFGTLPVQLQQWHPRAIGNTVLVPKEAKLPLHNGWRQTRRICHWPSNVKATIRKAKPHKHNTKLDCIRNTGLYLHLCSFTAFHCTISCTTALGNYDLRRGHSALVEVFAATSPECDPAAPTSNPLHNFIRLHYSKAFWEYLDFMKRLHDASVRWGQPQKSCCAPLIVRLLACSFLSANTTDLKFRCCSIFQWLCIQGNEPCLWYHGRLQKLLHHRNKNHRDFEPTKLTKHFQVQFINSYSKPFKDLLLENNASPHSTQQLFPGCCKLWV